MSMVQVKEENGFYVGTAAEFVASNAKINDQFCDQVGFSVLAKYGIIKVVGEAEKVEGKRGRPGKIFSVDSKIVKF